ncbi:MAG TPA: class I SAM-dependent methyltransferase [Ktedonobacterales bacterium]|nr:class I SAM-dependent methyltransferase [Ktedonobacterales bacterium]
MSQAPSPQQPDAEHLRRRASFDSAAELYDAARPAYPEELFEDLVALTGLHADSSILEVGSGTGKATLPLARRGFHILGIELGEHLAALARAKLAGYPQARIDVDNFETWPAPEGRFDVAVSASAWHWIDPAIGYPKIARALRPRGFFALMWNRQQRSDTTDQQNTAQSSGASDQDNTSQAAFSQALQEVIQQVAPGLAGNRLGRAGAGHQQFRRDGLLAASEFFETPVVRSYAWETTYDAANYLRLLDSYSSYRVLDPSVRDRLFTRIAEMIDSRFNGRVIRQWQTELYIAQRR